MSFVLVAAAAMAVAVSGLAAGEASAEPEMGLTPQDGVADSVRTYLGGASGVVVYTDNGRICAAVASSCDSTTVMAAAR